MNTAGTAWPAPSRAWWAVSLCCVAALLSYTDRLILGLLVDPIRADLQIGDTEVSLLQGVAFALIYSFAGLPLGRIADRHSRRNLILAGVLLWSAATVACGYAQSFAQLFAARVFVGIGEAALAPAAMSLIADYFPPQRRGTATGTFLMGMVVGGGAALAIGGFLLQLAGNGWFASWPVVGTLAPWRAVLVLLGLPGLVLGLLLLSLHEPARRERSGVAAPGWRESMQKLAAQKSLLLPLYFAMALLAVGDFSLLSWSPALLSRRYGYAADQIGLLLGGIAMVTGVVATVGGGWLADWYARRGGVSLRLQLACLAAALAVPGSLIGLAGPSAAVVLACFGLWSLLSSAAGCIGIGVLQQVLPNELRGFGTALMAFGNIILGLGVGASLTAVFTDRVYADAAAVGWSITTVTLPAALAALALLLLALRHTRRNAVHAG
ncbi:putative MFS family arabinose efflux permease [Tahibacter aquaticus]|uniref:Putative MFS family arabinose efflux permease n=1 Tax=Tahibacter aquaticus TaxID=520092 RepID=A0A4R6Z744_9GAMM|nr:MFS transporter [Tahibacter aquaticus]TDR47585.1 putative MFS family arabinose efflux permease [Tahibacter aquaticus]